MIKWFFTEKICYHCIKIDELKYLSIDKWEDKIFTNSNSKNKISLRRFITCNSDKKKKNKIKILTVWIFTVFGGRRTLWCVRSQMISIILMMHRCKWITSQRAPWTRKTCFRSVLLIRGLTWLTESTHVLRKLMGRGHVVTTRITTRRSQTTRVIKIIVLEFNEGRFAALRDGRARGAVIVVTTWSWCHRTAHSVVKVLLELRGWWSRCGVLRGSGTVSTTGRRATTAVTTRIGRTTTGHTVRGRGTRRTGVARPEWAPQIREIERRRGAPKLHFRRDFVAAEFLLRLRRLAISWGQSNPLFYPTPPPISLTKSNLTLC